MLAGSSYFLFSSFYFLVPPLRPERTAHLAELVEYRRQRIACAEGNRLDERAGEHDVPGGHRHAELVQLVRQPGDGVDRVAHHRRGDARLLDVAVLRQAGADAADIDLVQPPRVAAQHDEAARGGVADAVDHAA